MATVNFNKLVSDPCPKFIRDVKALNFLEKGYDTKTQTYAWEADIYNQITTVQTNKFYIKRSGSDILIPVPQSFLDNNGKGPYFDCPTEDHGDWFKAEEITKEYYVLRFNINVNTTFRIYNPKSRRYGDWKRAIIIISDARDDIELSNCNFIQIEKKGTADKPIIYDKLWLDGTPGVHTNIPKNSFRQLNIWLKKNTFKAPGFTFCDKKFLPIETKILSCKDDCERPITLEFHKKSTISKTIVTIEQPKDSEGFALPLVIENNLIKNLPVDYNSIPKHQFHAPAEPKRIIPENDGDCL
jgi:hypothetical protein